MYIHGTYGELKAPSTNSAASKSVVVYVGTAPIHKIPGGKTRASELVNTPLKITGLTSARNLLGYSEEAPFTYTLCEVIETHFHNSIENIGPVYVVNVFNPFATGNQEAATAKEFAVVKKIVQFTLGDLIFDEITVGDLTAGTDYKISYDSSSDQVTIKMLSETAAALTKVSIGGKVAKPSVITATDIIGDIDENGAKSGLKVLQDIYRMYDEIVNIIAAPGWSETPAVYEAMIETATKLNGHWDAFVNADLPAGSIATIEDAIDWKKEKGYDYGISKVYWPLAKRKDGKIFHLSTLASAQMLKQDLENGGVPFVSVSNKIVDAADQTGGTNFHGFDIEDGNILNAQGITTLVKWGGDFRLWGPHTAAYCYEDEQEDKQDPRYQFDTAIRTLLHITNAFQADNFVDIDRPMTPALKDQILQREQAKLDALVCMGALVGDNKIAFSEENTSDGVMAGDFIWDINTTTNVPFKSGTVKVGWTADGLSTLLGGAE